MGTRHPVQHLGHRQRHGEQHAVQDVEHENPHERGHGQHQLAPAKRRQAPETGQVDQAHGGVHDDGAEGGHREPGEQRAEEQQRGEHAGQGDEGVQLSAAPGRGAQGGPATTAADREPAHQPGADVGGAQPDQLPVGVHLVATPGGKGAAGENVVGVADDQDAQRRKKERAQVGQARQARSGQAGGHGAHHVDAPPVQVEGDNGRRGQQDHQKRDRQRGETPLGQEQEGQHGQGEQRRTQVGPAESADKRHQLLEEGVARHRYAGELRQLADHHDEGHAGQITHENRLGQQVGHEAQPHRPGRQAERPDEHRERGGQGGVASGIAAGERGHGHRGHQGGRRLRPDGQLSRRAEQRVRQERRHDRPQPGDRGQAGQRGVGHHLRDEVRGHGQPGQHIAPQPGAPVAGEGVESRPRGHRRSIPSPRRFQDRVRDRAVTARM